MERVTTDKAVHSFHLEDDPYSHRDAKDKPAAHHGVPDQLTQEALAAHLDEDEKRIKRIWRKLDLRLVLMLALLYVWAFIDRGNLGNANIAGMNKDLKLGVGDRYSVVTMIFFVGYILVDAPAMFIIRKIGATIWIPSVVVAWGIVTIGQGFVHSYAALIVCRILLGIFEGGLIPGAMYLIGVWYTRYEAHKRLAAFYVVGIASTGLSGLLAYGIEKMGGDDGIAGWRWIFIIEGVVTVACGVAAYFILVDVPEKATHRNLLGMPAFLSKEDAAVVMARIERDRGDSAAEALTVKSMFGGVVDWKIWEFSSYVMLNNTALYAFSYFLPVILQKGLKYSTGKAQLFTFPPYAVAVPWILFCGWFCDKMRIRGPMIIFNCCLYIIGVSITGFGTNLHARYGGVFLGVLGITGNIPTNWAYAHNNLVGQPKRALSVAMMTTGGACGGIIAGNVFRAQDSPNYRPGIIISMVFMAINVLLVVKNFFIFWRANRKADRGETLIEDQPGFRYTY